jgi:hypothetical protein
MTTPIEPLSITEQRIPFGDTNVAQSGLRVHMMERMSVSDATFQEVCVSHNYGNGQGGSIVHLITMHDLPN